MENPCNNRVTSITDSAGNVWHQAPLFAPGEIERVQRAAMSASADDAKPTLFFPAKEAVGGLELGPQWAMTLWYIGRLPTFKDHTYKP